MRRYDDRSLSDSEIYYWSGVLFYAMTIIYRAVM